MKTALLVNTSGLGDIVSSLIVGNALLAEYRVSYLIPASFRGLFTDTPFGEFVDDSLPESDFDLVIDLVSNKKSRKIIRRLSSSAKIGRAKNRLQRLKLFRTYTASVPKHSPAGHIVWDYLPILNKLQLQANKRIYLETPYKGNGSGISVHVGAQRKIRRIPLELVIKLSKYCETRGIPLRLIGNEAYEVAQALRATNGYAYHEYGSLKDLKHWLVDSKAVIASDSGVFHLSSALRVPTLGLYGPNTYARSGSINACAEYVELDYECRPCNQNAECPFNNRCMTEIPFSAIESFLVRTTES